MMAATVTIDKAYFETLLRRTQEYSALREALYRGGIAPETLEILIRGDFEAAQSDAIPDNNSLADLARSKPTLSRQAGNAYDSCSAWPSKEQDGAYLKTKPGLYGRQYSFGRDESSYPSELDRDDLSRIAQRPERQQYARAEQRTIIASNLSDRTTHKDLLRVIRGGTVLDIFLRTNDRSASISFVEGTAAQEFVGYVKRNDVYIHGKRVEWAWNDRQFILPGHVANKISIGATRNLAIRNIHPNITEARIREDLDHIHNLVIVDISYENRPDAHISLNSIHNAMFARTCMMSRLTYKGLRIEWIPDECSSPLPRQPVIPKKENTTKPVQKPSVGANRFQMLNMDGTDTSDDESTNAADDDTILTAFPTMKINPHSPWNPPTVAA